MDTGISLGISAFRWLAWLWMAAVLVVDRHALARPWLATAVVVAALVTTIARSRPRSGGSPASVANAAELAIGALTFVAGGWAYARGEPFATSQSLGVAWPLAGVFAAGAAWGPAWGAVAGGVVGCARTVGALVNGVPWSQVTGGGHLVGTLTPIVLFAMAGGVFGYLGAVLRRTSNELAISQARAEVARTLHDGVLQTLAAVVRRSDDPALIRLARDQERELRAFLTDGTSRTGRSGTLPLGARLAHEAREHESATGNRVDVATVGDTGTVKPAVADAVAGAVREALANVAKHAGASTVTLYVEVEDEHPARRSGQPGVFVSVRDDGAGFDPGQVEQRLGIRESVRGRIESVGGRVEVDSRPGRGTEVRLWA